MKIGDLVRCLHVEGKPLGVVASFGERWANVCVRGGVYPFRIGSLEIMK